MNMKQSSGPPPQNANEAIFDMPDKLQSLERHKDISLSQTMFGWVYWVEGHPHENLGPGFTTRTIYICCYQAFSLHLSMILMLGLIDVFLVTDIQHSYSSEKPTSQHRYITLYLKARHIASPLPFLRDGCKLGKQVALNALRE